MRRLAFNDGWTVRPKTNRFGEPPGSGAEWLPVTLPHDAMIGTERSPSATAATGYFPGGVWEYQRTFDVAAEDAGRAIVLEFEGVYRDAIVQVNGAVAAHWPYGYSSFAVPIDHLLRFGEPNEIRVEARAGRGHPLVLGRRHLPERLAARGRTGAPRARRRGRPHPRDRRRRRGGGGRRRGPQPVDDDLRRGASHARCSTLPARSVVRDEAPLTMFPGATITARRRLFVSDGPTLGPVDEPYLYTCRVTVRDGDEVARRRRHHLRHPDAAARPQRGLRINGEPVDCSAAPASTTTTASLGAATIDRAEERRVELLKEAGFNAIRSAHNPMSRAMLDACDRLGDARHGRDVRHVDRAARPTTTTRCASPSGGSATSRRWCARTSTTRA